MIVQYKSGINPKDFEQVSPLLKIVSSFYFLFCEIHPHLKDKCVITSIRDHVDGRISTTHRNGRAFDASIKGFTAEDIKNCKRFMQKHTGHFGAFSYSDSKQRVLVHHDIGKGDHFHFQVRRLDETFISIIKK